MPELSETNVLQIKTGLPFSFLIFLTNLQSRIFAPGCTNAVALTRFYKRNACHQI
jgi:hypothetical protein